MAVDLPRVPDSHPRRPESLGGEDRPDTAPDGLLAHVAQVAARRRWLVGPIIAVVVVLGVLGPRRMSTTYTARATLRLATPGSLDREVVRPDAVEYLDRLQNTYVGVAQSRSLEDRLVEKLGLDDRPAISLTPRPSSELLVLAVRAGDRDTAVAAVNELSGLLIERVRGLDEGNMAALSASHEDAVARLLHEVGEARRQRDGMAAANPGDAERARIAVLDQTIALKLAAVEREQLDFEHQRRALVGRSHLLSVLTPASDASASSRPGLPMTLGLSLFVGSTAALGLALTLEHFRRRVETVEEVEQAAVAPVLIRVAGRRLSAAATDDATLDAFRRLRTQLLVQYESQAVRSIGLVSPAAPDDAGSAAANLGMVMAAGGHRVLLVDADLTSPTLHAAFDLPASPGLADVLRREETTESAVARTGRPLLDLLPAGSAGRDGGDDVTLARVAKLLWSLEEQYDVVLVHVAPPTRSTDALVFAALVSQLMLVVAQGHTTATDIVAARREIDHAGGRVRGVVLTRARRGSLR